MNLIVMKVLHVNSIPCDGPMIGIKISYLILSYLILSSIVQIMFPLGPLRSVRFSEKTEINDRFK